LLRAIHQTGKAILGGGWQMSPLLDQVVEFLIMSVLVMLFAWIYVRDHRNRVGLWMVGWIAICIHFAVPLPWISGLLSANWLTFLKVGTLEVAGVSFMMSVSEVFAAPRKRMLFIQLVGVPAVLYLACLIWAPANTLIPAILLFSSIFFVIVSSCLYYGIKSRYVWMYSAFTVPYWLWAVAQVIKGNRRYGLIFFLSMLFITTGMLYWRHFKKRFTPGVMVTSISFVLWGAVFPTATLMHFFHTGPTSNSVFWDLPKYFVAFGMILTLFENENAAATSAAQRYQSLFEGNLAAVYVSTLEGQLLDCNSALIGMYGVESKQEMLATPNIAFYVDPADRRFFVEQLKRDGQVINFECRQQREKGSIFWILERATIFTTSSGEKLIEGTVIDITERKQAETALKESEELFATIFRHSPLGCAVVSLDGVVLNANEHLLKVLGLPADHVIGKTAVDLGFWQSSWERQRFYAKLRRQRSVENLEVEFRDTAGNRHVGLYFGRLVCIGEKECIFGMYLDRTEQRDLEARFLQAQKMEALGRLAGGVAHDFNNLLSIIGGYTELLEAQLPAQEDHKRYCDKILDTTRRASGLTRQLLTFSRKEITRPAALKPGQAIRELSSILTRLIGEDVELVFDLKGAGSTVIDKTHFEQIIFNIAVNARDAMPHGGKLSIKTEDMIRKTDVSLRDYIAITITDTGIGMDEQTRVRAFEPFFTTKNMGQGTGLGLATVYGIVQQCEGEISIESQPGQGTQITILLPASKGAETLSSQELALEMMPGRGRILLVEDETELRNANAEFLSSLGYSVMPAANGPEALELARTVAHIDLVVTDVIMPRMNGREFADELLKIFPGTQVLFVSGYTDDVVLQTGISDFGIAFLQKPFSLRTLAAKVREMLVLSSRTRSLPDTPEAFSPGLSESAHNSSVVPSSNIA
jgi:two-component system, cell cycle sensor histidine kinase and response regulator CckA